LISAATILAEMSDFRNLPSADKMAKSINQQAESTLRTTSCGSQMVFDSGRIFVTTVKELVSKWW